QISCTVAFTVCGTDRLDEWRWTVPRSAESPKIFLVQLLQRFRFAVAVQTLSDLQPKNFQRTGGRARAGTMRAYDQHRRTHRTYESACATSRKRSTYRFANRSIEYSFSTNSRPRNPKRRRNSALSINAAMLFTQSSSVLARKPFSP